MHGDDVASAGVEVTTQLVSKVTEIFMEMLKIAIEREREKNRLSGKSEVLSGGEVWTIVNKVDKKSSKIHRKFTSA